MFQYTDHLSGATDEAFANCESAILVGWSMGAEYALKLAVNCPKRVAGLVLIAATPRMMADSGWIGMSNRRLAALEMGLRLTLGNGFFGIPEGKPNPYLADSEENLARGIDFLRNTDLRRDLEENRAELAKIPAFIFQSERDPIVRASNAEYLATIFSNAKLEIVPGAEHALPIFIPEKIDSAVQSLL